MPVRITALIDPDTDPSHRRLAWLASDADDAPVGSAFLRLFTAAGQDHLAELQLNVHPAERRRHTGSRLLDAVVAAAREDGRRCVITQATAGSPGERFLSARGFRKVLTLTYTRLPLSDADIATLVKIIEQPHPGYRLASWDGAVPDELAETFVVSRHAMDDMPMGSIDFGTVTWDLERVRAAASAVEKRGDRLHTVVAISETDGAVAGFTELVVPGDGKGDAQHYGTGVLPEHRGHGLGLWMKAASIRQARERYPQLGGLLTDTADDNPYMQRINDSLGYTPTHTAYEYQLDL
ncbi:GNAT family N-acetyltransferase [Actinoallomurus rhizosphaericola]|uniref:GNAT family N-acetyltransferase n=1 Tax=Actinoallomurus rhizosphaericola TaxID=2952536 RepID=UPI002092C9BC|nr:GNAT family N-acetyltransferase [Actinoallomurus rhizosphaericola]MCO5998812.1 GNAT family N-acetyltransferase [Actinoallomurus rhizosphaericola]